MQVLIRLYKSVVCFFSRPTVQNTLIGVSCIVTVGLAGYVIWFMYRLVIVLQNVCNMM